jgi:hypothetical protein
VMLFFLALQRSSKLAIFNFKKIQKQQRSKYIKIIKSFNSNCLRNLKSLISLREPKSIKKSNYNTNKRPWRNNTKKTSKSSLS